MKASILTIGNEILTGDILNTNSRYFSLELNNLGFEVDTHLTIDDDFDTIASFIKSQLGRPRLILVSGGLGPTKDDATKAALAEGLGLDMVLYEESKLRLEKYFADKPEALANNLNQAFFPIGSKLLINHYGTADGFYLAHRDLVLVVVPGPPRENIPMFDYYAKALLKNHSNHRHVSRYYRIFEIGEWETEKAIKDLVEGPDYVATFARTQGLFIKVSLDTSIYSDLEGRFYYYESILKDIFKENLVDEGIKDPENLLADYLIAKDISVSTAESITGGLIASKLVGVPGVSSVLKESYVTYSDQVKERVLGVKASTIRDYGVVSKETVKGMLSGLAKVSSSDLCIATSGYAGPGEGAGKVVYGILYKDTYLIKEKNYKGDRNQIRHRTANDALIEAYRLVSN